jgi:trehalose 6-phosphate synthase/phosphatase
MEEQTSGQAIVVVSNRLPVTVRRVGGARVAERSIGGLVAALDPALRSIGGTWVGWPGDSGSFDRELGSRELGYALEPVPLTALQVRHYYHGFSNRTLWPLFHSLPTRVKLEPREWLIYDAVNRRMAEVAAKVAGPADLIWVHDYHLMRTAGHLRELRPEAQLVFFLHIPFPPFDIFRILPWSRQVLHGLLSCDLVGLHCPPYVSNFLDCAERLMGGRVDRGRGLIEYGERTVRVAAFPLGIDFEAFAERARSANRAPGARELRVILGVDRLDYTKGIPDRIRAFERLLETHPQYRGKVVLVQLAVPSRAQVAEYQALKREIDELVGRINGRFGSYGWTPIESLYRSMSQHSLAALYRDADVALITPLRDGMNLVAKEYVACQIGEPGVLILSRLTGAAESMHEALLVNPYDVDGVAAALHQALTMSLEERAERLARLQEREKQHDLHHWLSEFLTAARDSRARIEPLTAADFERSLGAFTQGRRLALFVDYDGTLTPLTDHPSKALLSDEMRVALEACAARDDTDVTIVSGRALEDVRGLVPIPGLALVGNHGLQISGPDLAAFEHPDAAHCRRRVAELARSLQRIEIPGVWVEEKGLSLTLHYRAADPAVQARVAEEARAHMREAGFQARDAHCAVEGRPPIGWDKGRAVLHILRARYGPAWSLRIRVIYVGDDETDEDAFRALSGLGATFRVGPPRNPTLAQHRLPGVSAVHALLDWLGKRPVAAS